MCALTSSGLVFTTFLVLWAGRAARIKLEEISETLSKESSIAQLNTDFDLDAITGGLVNNTAGGPALPTPDDFYAEPSPFEQWYPEIPANFGKWETHLVENYKKTFEKAGSPRGIRENDHNFGTLLGQGNTLGFVTAKLTNDLRFVPAFTKHGLFSEDGEIDAVVRFSDFGDDTSTTRFTRIAIKLPLKSAWAGEVNLLFTESMDTFPIANYGQLAVGLGGDYSDDPLRYGSAFAKNVIGVLGVQNFADVVLGDAFKYETLAKDFYSQLPYMLGEDHAMKFQLLSRQKTCGDFTKPPCCLPQAEKPASKEEAKQFAKLRASRIAAFLSQCDATYELMVQTKPYSEISNFLEEGSTRWRNNTFQTMGTLTIPKQQCDAEYAVNEKLRSALAETLEVKPEGVDKMFAFHPIATHEANRPIGDVCTFRAGFYAQHSKARYDTYEQGVFQKTDGESLNKPVRMPFEELKIMGVF